LERHNNILVVVSFGLGAFSRKFLRMYPCVIALNPNAILMGNNKGRRYCIGSQYQLDDLCMKINEIEEGWGGHANIICSPPIRPSKLELNEVINCVQRSGLVDEAVVKEDSIPVEEDTCEADIS